MRKSKCLCVIAKQGWIQDFSRGLSGALGLQNHFGYAQCSNFIIGT